MNEKILLKKNQDLEVQISQLKQSVLSLQQVINNNNSKLSLEAEQNISEIKKRETKLQELNTTKDKLFSIIAHDLRSPFNSILGITDIALESIRKKNYSSIEEYCLLVKQSTQQSYNLLDNLLQWSQIQIGRMPFYPTLTNINGTLKKAISLFNVSLNEKKITLNFKIDSNLRLIADGFMLETILRNLISNAIKYSESKGKIIISAHQEKECTQISVQDFGIGITPKKMNQLFKIEGNYTTLGTKKEKGTGLGLILCKEFVEKHKGEIWGESSPEEGTKFIFTIPNQLK